MTWTRTRVSSPLGDLWVAAHAQAVCGLWFAESHQVPAWMAAADVWVAPSQPTPAHPLLHQAKEQLAAYFAGDLRAFDLPLDVSWGTVFQQAVWQQLDAIAWGKTATYAQVAQAVGRPRAVRAVGTAIGRNPISLLRPCHRVVGAQGQLAGYSGGLARKQALLLLERGL